MIEKKDLDLLMRQMRAALMSQEITEEMKTQAEDLQDFQSALQYLSVCLRESDAFLGELCSGRLETDPPGRHNFIAGNLKELHSVLKHLTWQTAQVASGDYNQRVRFLGEFSDSFNTMVDQLKDRETSLSAKTNALTQSMNFLRAILDVQRDWVVVTDVEYKQVIYVNLAAQQKFFNPEDGVAACLDYKMLLDRLLELEGGEPQESEYLCAEKNLLLQTRSFPLDWHGRQAFVHCISDVTDEREEKENLHNMAYRDTLTGTYNRRYCVEKIKNYLSKEAQFSLVLIDLDGLKQVNDGMGHLLGDDYIITVSQTIMEASRTDDKLCRIGGDEFVLLLPECSEANAEKKMSRVCAGLAQVKKEYPMAISYGIVETGEAIDADASPEELFSLADVKMYGMKQAHKREQ